MHKAFAFWVDNDPVHVTHTGIRIRNFNGFLGGFQQDI